MAEISKILGLMVIILVLAKLGVAQKRKNLQIQNISHDCNKEYISEFYIRANNDSATLDIKAAVIKAMTRPLWLEFNMFIKGTKKADFNRIVGFDINVCDVLEKANNPLLSTWIDIIFRQGNMDKKCPMKEGTYHWKQFKIDKDTIPHFILKGFYRIGVLGYDKRGRDKEMILNVTLYASIKMK
ncbi:uncharacterized protein LOC106093023 [Stomoxys calcitrans]|uniref:MD-2-related lipid-recognition domain-containing protein n=1 Tax=Stomoxys calcitrans TaxID=35570 RepID=A0A1I8P6C3_STOCA|nr:uncharacterized protein LOC131995825 [Stomoxys calcitrans]XP_059226656.1 uncharacterized protein LOC106093023 [Stomoxys calcitrans]